MAKDFRAAWAEIKQQREQETSNAGQRYIHSASTLPHPTKASSSPRRRKPVADLDHLIDQLRNPQIEAELADAAWYKARREIFMRDPKNFKYNTRLG